MKANGKRQKAKGKRAKSKNKNKALKIEALGEN